LRRVATGLYAACGFFADCKASGEAAHLTGSRRHHAVGPPGVLVELQHLGALFVTVKAVVANLSRVYAKLGVRSRTELAQRFARETEPRVSGFLPFRRLAPPLVASAS
jgi:hypothetical protein